MLEIKSVRMEFPADANIIVAQSGSGDSRQLMAAAAMALWNHRQLANF